MKKKSIKVCMILFVVAAFLIFPTFLSAGTLYVSVDNFGNGYVDAVNPANDKVTTTYSLTSGFTPDGFVADSNTAWISSAGQNDVSVWKNGVHIGDLLTTYDPTNLSPQGILGYSGNIFAFSISGPVDEFIGGAGTAQSFANVPVARNGEAYDAYTGLMYVTTNSAVMDINPANGQVGTLIPSSVFGTYPEDNLRQLAIDGQGDVFVVDTAWDPLGPQEGRVWKMKLNPDGSVASSTMIYSGAGGLNGIAYDGSKLYVSSYYEGKVYSMNTDGSGVTTILTGLNEVTSLTYVGSSSQNLQISAALAAQSVVSPEPSTLILSGVGLIGFSFIRKKQKKN